MNVGDPRFDILDVLRRKDSSVDDLSPQLGISPTATRQHLSIFERDGLITRTSVKEKVGDQRSFMRSLKKLKNSFQRHILTFLNGLSGI